MFDRSAAVKLQLRDKKGKWIKMGAHIKWHSLEDDTDVTGIARGQSGMNIVAEFTSGGHTYHINVPANKVEAINAKASLDPAYVDKMGGHVNTPNPHDAGVSMVHTVTHYGASSPTHLTTKISDLKPGDVVYPIKNHDSKTPASIQKSPYNTKDPSGKIHFQKFAGSGHGVVKDVVKDKDTGQAKYAIITDKNGKDHYPSASHYAVKQSDALDSAILKAHADESNAMGKTTKSSLISDIKGTHTTQDKFDAAAAPVGSKIEATGIDGTHIPLTKTGENEWAHEGNGTKLSDDVANHMMGLAPEKSKDDHILNEDNGDKPLDISGWTKKPGTQMGSNAGGIYTDQNGKEWYVKFSASDDHARNEVLADDLYKAAGIQTSNLKLADVGNGKLGTASEMMPDTKKDLQSHLNDPEYMAKIQDGFAMDALLANWDVAGLAYDNIITDEHGNPVRVDPGGALLFRAQGQPKGNLFGKKADEWDSLRGLGATSNLQAKSLFGQMTDQQLADSAKHVEALTPEKIDSIVDKLGFDDKTSKELKDKLAARREDILDRASKLNAEPEEAPKEEAADKVYTPAEVASLPNGAIFSGSNGSVYKQANKWYMTFTPNSNKDGMPITPAMAETAINEHGFKPVGDTHIAKEIPDAPEINYSDKLPEHDKKILAEGVKYPYAFTSEDDPHHLFPGYNQAEKEQLADFILSSSGLNEALRDDSADHYAFEIATMDQILDKSPITEDTTVFRGLSVDAGILDNLVNGDVYFDKGYTSSSTLESVAHGWVTNPEHDQTPVIMEIDLPAGFKAHKIDYAAVGFDGYGGESEVVLPRGTKFKVTGKEEYTNSKGDAGWRVKMTPYLSEHNFDTGEENDHTAGSPEGHGTGADSEQVHGDGGSDSEGHAGGDSVSGPADTGSPSSPQEEPQGQGQVAQPAPANHPDFEATYPDKGKDQIDANGKTIKVNDLIHHPKKGVGKVFIGLPSTNSVKVVYPDGSKATHLSKAVTKVEGDAPQIEALPSDLKVGDHGIDPATHTAYIVGNKESLIHIGDSVTHANGDTGIVKAIYKGEKTVSVKWDNGTTSTKKASTLESATKHTPQEHTAPEEAPATPEPAHDETPEAPTAPEEPAHEEAPTPDPEPETVPEEAPATGTSPLVGKSLKDPGVPPIKDLPVGTVITNMDSGDKITKMSDGMWHNDALGDIEPETVEKVSGYSFMNYRITSVPDASHDVHGAGPDLSEIAKKNPADLTKDEVSALPVGTEIKKGPGGSYFQKKIGDNQWQMYKESTNGPAFTSVFNSDDDVLTGLQNSAGAYKSINLPTEGVTPVHTESVPEVLDDPSVEDLAKLPDGTVLHDDMHPHMSWTKEGDVWTSSGGPHGPHTLAPSDLSDGATYKVTAPGTAPNVTAPTEVSNPSIETLNGLPDGIVLKDPQLPKYTFVKEDGEWYQEGPHGKESLSPKEMADGTIYSVEHYPSSGSTSTPESEPTPEAGTQFSEFVNQPLSNIMDAGKFMDLPLNSEIGMPGAGAVYKKVAEDTWKKFDAETGADKDMVLGDENFINLSDSSLESFHVLKEGDGTGPEPTPAETISPETGHAALTGVTTGQAISKELLDAQPVGTTMKKESVYGSSAFYYVKQSDGTWKLFKNGQEKESYSSDNIKGEMTATFGVPTPGSKFFYSKTGEIVYEGDKVDYKGTPGTVKSITNTGLVSIKLDGEDKAKYKSASQLIKSASYGVKTAPTYQPSNTPNLSTTPSADSHTGGSETADFAGAMAETFDQKGLTMPSTTNDSHLASGLTLAPSHEADPSNPLYNTPAPQAPASPAAYPAFQQEQLDLPKWDSAKWLEAVKARYDANPNKAKATVEESAKWAKIQSVLNGEKLHIDDLTNSKYLDEDLKKEAIDGINAQEEKNKPLIAEHNAKVAEAKKAYDEAKAKYLDEYADQKKAFNEKMDAWVVANPNQNALKDIQMPETSKENFTGGSADWTKAHAGTFSAQTVFDSVKKDDALGTKGLSIATDSDQVEGLDAKVMKILDTSGKKVLEVKFKLTGPFGAEFEKTLKPQAGVTKTPGIYSNYLVEEPYTKLLQDKGKPPTSGSWVHSGTRYSWTDPSTGAEVIFQRSNAQGVNVSAVNNTVRIHLPETATPEDYQKVLENMGINAKPSTEGDIRVLAENQLLSMMGQSAGDVKIFDGNKNLSGAERQKQLQEIEQKFGITVDDMTFASESNGKVRFFLNDEKAQKLADDYGVKAFVHSVSDSYGPDTWVNMLTGSNKGLLSTYHRWNEGIGGTGMSSMSDHEYGSSDYVYITPTNSPSNYGHSVVINPKSIFRRTDWWANTGDNYGKKGSGTYTSPHDTFSKVSGSSGFHGGIHEVLPKDSVPLSDWMYVVMDSDTRLKVIKELKERGILKINGIPVEDFILAQGMPVPKGVETPVVA